MEINNIFNIILLIGSALSLVMAIFLWINSSGIFANKVLGAMNFLWFVVVFVFAMQSKEFYMKFPHFSKIISIIPIMLFPLLFIYIKSYLSDYRWKFRGFAVHFIPALAYLIAISPYYFQSADSKRTIISDSSFPEYLTTVGMAFDVVIILQGIFYTTISMKLIQQFSGSAGKLTSHQIYLLNWLKFFVISYVFLWAFGAIGALLEMLSIVVPFDLFSFFYLGLTILTISIGVFALRRPEILQKPIIQGSGEIKQGKGSPSKDSSRDVQLMLDYLEKERAYLKNDLSMNDMVEATGIPKHRISALLNNELGKSFYEIVNEYRTHEAIRLMNEGKHVSFTLTYIAEMAGFNSKATFNRIFKKITNRTPVGVHSDIIYRQS